MPETTVTNLPVTAIWIVAIAQIVFALAMGAIAVVLIMMIGQLKEILADVNKMTDEANKHLPAMLGNVEGTLKNVKTISDDANATVHNVTGTVNRVSHVVGSVAGRMESPVIRAAGALTGIVAGAKALRGGKKEVVIKEEPKRRGRLGIF